MNTGKLCSTADLAIASSKKQFVISPDGTLIALTDKDIKRSNSETPKAVDRNYANLESNIRTMHNAL